MSMRTISPLLAMLVIAWAAADAQGQGPVSGVDGRLLGAGVESLTVYVVRDGDTTRTGAVWDELATVDVGGRPALRRIYRTEDRVLGVRLDTIVDELPTLAPIRSRSLSRQGIESLDFAPGRVRGWMRLVNGDSVPIDAALAGTVYNSATFDLVLRAAPLREGWRAEVPAFLTSSRTVARLRARVTGVDSIGAARCWRVDAEFAGMPVTFWVNQRSRKLCQQVMHVQPTVQILFAPPLPERPSRRSS